MKNKFYFTAGFALLFLGACNPNPHKTITVKDPNTGEKTEVEVTKGLMTVSYTHLDVYKRQIARHQSREQ